MTSSKLLASCHVDACRSGALRPLRPDDFELAEHRPLFAQASSLHRPVHQRLEPCQADPVLGEAAWITVQRGHSTTIQVSFMADVDDDIRDQFEVGKHVGTSARLETQSERSTNRSRGTNRGVTTQVVCARWKRSTLLRTGRACHGGVSDPPFSRRDQKEGQTRGVAHAPSSSPAWRSDTSSGHARAAQNAALNPLQVVRSVRHRSGLRMLSFTTHLPIDVGPFVGEGGTLYGVQCSPVSSKESALRAEAVPSHRRADRTTLRAHHYPERGDVGGRALGWRRGNTAPNLCSLLVNQDPREADPGNDDAGAAARWACIACESSPRSLFS